MDSSLITEYAWTNLGEYLKLINFLEHSNQQQLNESLLCYYYEDLPFLTCLKKEDTVRVTGRKESRQAPNSSGDQLRLFSLKLRRSSDPRRVREPEPLLRFNSS